MSRALLPHTLLEFTLARASARLETLAQQSARRNPLVHGKRHTQSSAALAHADAQQDYVPYEGYADRSLYSRCVSLDWSFGALLNRVVALSCKAAGLPPAAVCARARRIVSTRC